MKAKKGIMKYEGDLFRFLEERTFFFFRRSRANRRNSIVLVGLREPKIDKIFSPEVKVILQNIEHRREGQKIKVEVGNHLIILSGRIL